MKGFKEAEAEAVNFILLRLLKISNKEIKGSIEYIVTNLNKKQFKGFTIVDSMKRIKNLVDIIAKYFIEDEEI